MVSPALMIYRCAPCQYSLSSRADNFIPLFKLKWRVYLAHASLHHRSWQEKRMQEELATIGTRWFSWSVNEPMCFGGKCVSVDGKGCLGCTSGTSCSKVLLIRPGVGKCVSGGKFQNVCLLGNLCKGWRFVFHTNESLLKSRKIRKIFWIDRAAIYRWKWCWIKFSFRNRFEKHF